MTNILTMNSSEFAELICDDLMAADGGTRCYCLGPTQGLRDVSPGMQAVGAGAAAGVVTGGLKGGWKGAAGGALLGGISAGIYHLIRP